jgi:hypothetical protein
VLETWNIVLYTSNMTRGVHPKKEIRDALSSARAAGIEITPKPGSHGHSWGHLRCLTCGDFKSVWSTPKNPASHAKDIARWADRHAHKEE